MTLSEEIRNALEDKNDLIMQGLPLPRDGKLGDIRTNIFNKGKTFMAMKASQDQWVFSMAFTEQMSSNRLEDYLLLSGGKMHDNSKIDAYDITIRNDLILSSLDVGHIPYIGADGLVSTDNGQLFWDAANNRLGVGIATPKSALNVAGNIGIGVPTSGSIGTDLTITNNSGNAERILFQRTDSSQTSGVGTNGNPATLAFYVGGNEYATILPGGNVGINETAPDEKLEVNGNVHITGDSYWTGDGSGLLYGSCYGNDIDWTQVAAQNVWYNIVDADMATGELNGVTHDGSGKLTIARAGRYLITLVISTSTSIARKHMEAGIEISGTGTAIPPGRSHYELIGVDNELEVTGSAIVDLAVNSTIEGALRTTDAGNPTITVQHLNITVVLVGGT